MTNKLKLKGLLREMTVNEEVVNGLVATEKARKESKTVNDKNQTDVGKTFKDYEEPVMPKEDKDIDKMNKPGNPEDNADIENTDVRNDMSLLNIEGEPNEVWEERQRMALEGDSKMGNETKTGKWNPETGEGNGNTEETWGASGGKVIGEKIAKDVKDIKAMRKKEGGKEVDKYNMHESKINKKINENKNTMKRLRFKKPFDGLTNALQLIPETYRTNEKEFEMTDGVENYTIRWEGNLNEGKAIVLKAADKNMINEDIDKMKHLMGFKSEDTLGTLKGNERIDENASFREVWDMTKNILNEGEESEEVLTEHQALSVGGMGFVSEDDVNEEDEVVSEDCGNEDEDLMEDDVNEEDEVVTEDEEVSEVEK